MQTYNSEHGKEAILNYYNMLIGTIKIPYKELDMNTKFGNTHIFEFGNPLAPPLILLHGSSMNSAMWFGDVENFVKDYHVFALDMPGEPGKSSEIQYPFDTSDYSDWLLEVINSLNLDKISLIGLSLGGWLATKFSICNLERVSKLVILCPAGIGSQNHEFKEIALSLLPKGKEGLEELFLKINGSTVIPDIVLNFQKLIAAFFNTRKEEIPLFTDEQLASLNMPVLLFVGGKDILLRSDETAERISRLVKNAEIVVFPEKGHSLVGLSLEILAFLNK